MASLAYHGGNINFSSAYNSRLQPARIQATSGSGTILDLSYGFALGLADNGNVRAIANLRDPNRSQHFAYDELSRIATAKTQATTGSTAWGQSFTYDRWGNLYSVVVTQGTGVPPLNVTPNNMNRFTTGYTYDSAGNLTSDGSTWDAESRLKAGGGVTYTYDGDGKRAM